MTFHLSPSRVTRTLLELVVLLHCLSFAGQYSKHFLGHDYLLGFVPKFFVGTESNVPTWFSAALLLACAGALALAALSRPRGAPDTWYWIGLSSLFCYLSLDEAAGLHELSIAPIRDALAGVLGADRVQGYLFLPWVIPAALLALLVFVATVPFLKRLPTRTSVRFVFAGAVYLGGALGMETLGAPHFALGPESWLTTMFLTAEEALEMLGALLFLHAILSHLAGETGSIRFTVSAGVPAAPVAAPARMHLRREPRVAVSS